MECRVWLRIDTKLMKLRKRNTITFAARRHNVNVLLSNSTFLIFTVLVV